MLIETPDEPDLETSKPMASAEPIQTLAFALENTEALYSLWTNRFSLAIASAKPRDFSTCEPLGESILQALRLGAMDIHIEHRQRTTTRIKTATAGAQELHVSWGPKEIQSAFQSLFFSEESEPFHLDTPRGTSAKLSTHGIDVKLRMQSVPSYPAGFDIILRILPSKDMVKFKTLIEEELLTLSTPEAAQAAKNNRRI